LVRLLVLLAAVLQSAAQDGVTPVVDLDKGTIGTPGGHGSYGHALGANLLTNLGNGAADSAFDQEDDPEDDDENDPTAYFATKPYQTSSKPRVGTADDWTKAGALTFLNNANLGIKHYNKFQAGEGSAEEVSTEFVNEGLDTAFRTGGTLTGPVAEAFQTATGKYNPAADQGGAGGADGSASGAYGGAGGADGGAGGAYAYGGGATQAGVGQAGGAGGVVGQGAAGGAGGVAPWQSYMNAGIQTGTAFAMLGGQTATAHSNGKGNGQATGQAFADLASQSGNTFAGLSGGAPVALNQAPAASTLPSPTRVPIGAALGIAAIAAFGIAATRAMRRKGAAPAETKVASLV